jgi:3D (Asp-Asp-Asp) domain-containing protein
MTDAARIGTAFVDVQGDFSTINKQVAAFSARLGKTGKLAGAFGLVGAGAVVLTKQLYDIGEAFDTAEDKIRVGTGKTGKQLKGLKRDFKAVVSTVPADFGDAGDAIAEINRRLDLTGKPLRRLSSQFLELSNVTDSDLQGNIQTVTRLFGDWGIKTRKQPATLDKLFRASQATGIEVGKLSDYMVQFGSPLRQLGFDFDTAAAMFSKFEKEGVNLQTAMPGLRMALKNFASEGKDPATALAATIDKIKEAGSAAEANTMAFDIFGTRAGPDLASAIREGRFDFDKLIGTIRGGGDTIRKAGMDTRDFTEHWELFKQRVMVKLEPLANKVFNKLGDSMERVGDILTDPKLSNEEKFSRIFDMVAQAGSKAFSKIASQAGQHAPQAALAFVKGFTEADIWGKLAISGFLLAKFGGRGAFAGLGAQMGTAMGGGMAASTVATARTGIAAKVGASPILLPVTLTLLSIPFLQELEDEVKDAVGPSTFDNMFPDFDDNWNQLFGQTDKKFGQFNNKLAAGSRDAADKFRLDRLTRRAKKDLEPLPGAAGRVGAGINRNLLPKLDTLVQQGGQKGDAFAGALGGSFGDAATTVHDALGNIGANVDAALGSLGAAKASKFQLKKYVAMLPTVKSLERQSGGPIRPALATGGLAALVPGDSVGDKHTLSLNGQPVAKVESKEGIFVGNRNLMAAMADANAKIPRFQKGGALGREPSIIGPDPLRSLGQAGIHKVFAAAAAYVEKHKPKGGPGGAAFGPDGVGTYKGVPMANWVIQALQHAASKGASPQPTSGYRSEAQNHAEGRFYKSEHEGTQYPYGAVDYGGYTTGYAAKMSVVNATRDFKYPLLAPIGFEDDGHASGTGHQRGGLVQMLIKGGFVSSAYGPPWDAMNGTGVTATGVDLTSAPEKFIVAVDPDVIKLGTQLSIHPNPFQTSELFGAEDTGEAIQGNRIDFYDWRGRASQMAWGMRDVNVSSEGVATGASAQKHEIPKQIKGSTKGGATSKGGGTVAAGHYKVTTDRLSSFGSLPSNLDACNKELRIRQRELSEYRAAAAQAKDPEVKRALQVNAKLIEIRVGALRKQRRRLVMEAATKKAVAKIANAANFEAWTKPNTGIFARREEVYERAQERAEQIIDLEPEVPVSGTSVDWVDKVLKSYVDGSESPAFAHVLGSEASRRNAYIGAEQFAENRMEDWRVQIERLHHEIDFIQALKKSDPKAYARRKDQIPGMQARMKALRGDIVKTRGTTLPEWEEALAGVQGRGRTHALLDTLPGVPTGAFGGDIFQTQLAIKDLELKVPQALADLDINSGGSGDDSMRAGLLEEMLRQANQRTAVSEAQGVALEGWDEMRQGFAGKFAAGGSIPAGMWGIAGETGRPEIIHGPAEVFSPSDSAQMMGGGASVIVNGDIVQEAGDTRPAIEVRSAEGDLVEDVLTSTGVGRRHPSASAFRVRS